MLKSILDRAGRVGLMISILDAPRGAVETAVSVLFCAREHSAPSAAAAFGLVKSGWAIDLGRSCLRLRPLRPRIEATKSAARSGRKRLGQLGATERAVKARVLVRSITWSILSHQIEVSVRRDLLG